MRLLLVPALLLVSAAPAAALCPIYPDDAATGYSANATAHALCLQQELQQRTREAAERARIEAEIGNMRIEAERSRQVLLQRLAMPQAVTPAI